jgi:hypothetical protein
MATNVLTIALALALAGVIASILHGLRMRRDVAGLQLFVDQAVEQTMRHPARLSVVRRLIDHGGVPELDALVEATATLLKVPCCVPVSLGGWVLGTLCVWDHEPREWTRAEEETLTRLAAEVEARFAAIFEGTAPA